MFYASFKCDHASYHMEAHEYGATRNELRYSRSSKHIKTCLAVSVREQVDAKVEALVTSAITGGA